ncbi:MAG: hypothetical protein AAB368_15120, partial [bacterium]
GFAALGWLLAALSKSGAAAAAVAGTALYGVWLWRKGGRRQALMALGTAAVSVWVAARLTRGLWPSADLFAWGVYGPVLARQVAEAGLTHYAELIMVLGGAPLVWWALASFRRRHRPVSGGLQRLHAAAAALASAVFLMLTFYGGLSPAFAALLVPPLAILAALRLAPDHPLSPGGVPGGPREIPNRLVVAAVFAAQVAFAGLYEGSQTFGWRRIGEYLKSLPVQSVGTLSRDDDHAAAFEAVVRYVAGKNWSGVMESTDTIRVALADDVSPAEARALAKAWGRELALVPMYASNGLRHVVLAGRRAGDIESVLRTVPPPAPGNTSLPGERVSRIQADYLFHNY